MGVATPVAFFIFNRPDVTAKVFAKIAAARPRKLLLVADAPRSAEETDGCRAARAVVEKIDWECEVLRNFSEVNLGCRRRVSSGLDWVFSQVEEAIILEDDCLPTPSFFDYCSNLLERYRDDERIMHISGDNFQRGQSRTDASYYFSHYPHIWGWASWRRAWQYYDVTMATWPANRALIRGLFANEEEANFWAEKFDRVYAGKIDTWAHQWTYTCLSQSGLTIAPNVNLVSNIGFGPGATHARRKKEYAELPTVDIGELRHPQFVVRHAEADDYAFNWLFARPELRLRRTQVPPPAPASPATRFTKALLRRFRSD